MYIRGYILFSSGQWLSCRVLDLRWKAWLFDSLQMQGVVVSLSKTHYPLLNIDSTQKTS